MEEDKICYIYSLEDPQTQNIRYIGKCDNLFKRYKQHMVQCYKEKKSKKNNWIKSLLNNCIKPVINIIDTVNISEWQFWERHYISLYKSWGFNLTNMTHAGDGGVMPLEIREISQIKLRKPILQYTRGGIFIREWGSIEQANKNYNCTSSCIWNVLNNIRPTFKNCLWRYKVDENYPLKIEGVTTIHNEMPNVIKGRKSTSKKLTGRRLTEQHRINCGKKNIGRISHRRRPIIQYDSNHNFMKEWDCVKHAGNHKVSGVSTPQIYRYLRGELKTANGFHFKYKDES